MEVSHGQLRTGLTDGLSGYNADSLSHLYGLARCHVGSVALRTYSGLGLTGKDCTYLYGIPSHLFKGCNHLLGLLGIAHMVGLDNDILGLGIYDGLGDISACQSLRKLLYGLVAVLEGPDLHVRDLILALAAVSLPYDHILGYIHKTSGQVT